MTSTSRLLSLATVEAPHPAEQSAVLALVRELFRDADFDLDELASVFDNAGVDRRTFALPLGAYAEPIGPTERNAAFLEVTGALLERVARDAVPAELRERVTHVVTVTSSGIATPSLECDVIERVGLSPSARRMPLFGLGCAGGAAGLAVANDLARADPDTLVLVLCAELTSLTYLQEDISRRNFVACALFGDGAAAALVGGASFDRAPGLPVRLGVSATRLFPDSRDMMGWTVRDRGWEVAFSPRIPSVARRHAAELVALVADRKELRHFALHPGGRKVLDAYRDALDLSGDELRASEGVLARHGNMSAVTVMFVLEQILREPEPGPGIATAFGPGFTADLLTFDVAADLLGSAP